MFATHPPLKERIRRIEPDWDGKYPKIEAPPKPEAEKSATTRGVDLGGLITGTAILAGAFIGTTSHAATSSRRLIEWARDAGRLL